MLKYSLISFLALLMACSSEPKIDSEPEITVSTDESSVVHLLTDFQPLHADGDVNAVIEIPAGSIEKWELNKTSGQIERDSINNQPRTINYLGYPANYGMIPRTLLPKENGGDGDPLDIVVIGIQQERGAVVKCKVLGVLRLMDNGEQDDKIIAVSTESALYAAENLQELNLEYPGISQSLELWFTNYKGPGGMETKGFGTKAEALEMIKLACDAFESR